MIRDLAQASSDELPVYDLCIVGSGPAGGVVAAELAGAGLRIAVLESGRERVTARGDALRRVVGAELPIKAWSRERVLGGASTTWAGLSSPLDELDLVARPELGRVGWPIPRGELEPYWRAAAERYRFAPPEAFGPGGFERLRERGELRPAFGPGLVEKVFLAADPPQDFGRELRARYAEPDVDVWLDATVQRLVGDPGGRRVEAAQVRTRQGATLAIRARAFVLATGGIENARLLLCSRDLCPAGLGNEHDQVGRYFMNHPKDYRGILHLVRPVRSAPYWFGCLWEGFAGYGGLAFSDAELRRRALLASYVRLEPLFPWSDDLGVESLVTLAKRSKGLLSAWKRRRGGSGQVVELRDYSETGDDSELQNARAGRFDALKLAGTALVHAPSVASYLWYRLVPGQVPAVRRARLRNFLEMEPDPENRVTLSEELDVDGKPLPRVRWRVGELARRSIVELHRHLGDEFERVGLGRLESDLAVGDPWPIAQDASHHMGTTRMGDDPRTSVVTRDLALHGCGNVFLAGASVFPTGGCANPTYTLVALSIRLAEHLRRALPRLAQEVSA